MQEKGLGLLLLNRVQIKMTGNFSKKELIRYSRQMSIPEIGKTGQEKLKGSSVLVVGLGGLGSPAAIYLASVGIGKLGIGYLELKIGEIVGHPVRGTGILKFLFGN